MNLTIKNIFLKGSLLLFVSIVVFWLLECWQDSIKPIWFFIFFSFWLPQWLFKAKPFL